MKHGRAFLGAAGVAVLTGLILPILFGEPALVDGRTGGDPWRNWVYDFQTLITGLAAVGAATWTISVMESTDRKQTDRHRELVELNQRSDLRRLERAIEPQLEELEDIAVSLAGSELDPALFKDQRGDPVYNLVTSAAANYLTAVRRIYDVLERKQFVDGSELFDGRLTYSLRELFEKSEYLRGALEDHVKATSWEDPDFSMRYEFDFDGFEAHLLEQLRGYRRKLDSVVSRLRETKERHAL